MLVHVIPMHVVEMAIMKIVNVALMANRRVPAIRAMLVRVVGVVFFGTCGHWRHSCDARLSSSPITPSLG
jgi:hypothetical protein